MPIHSQACKITIQKDCGIRAADELLKREEKCTPFISTHAWPIYDRAPLLVEQGRDGQETNDRWSDVQNEAILENNCLWRTGRVRGWRVINR